MAQPSEQVNVGRLLKRFDVRMIKKPLPGQRSIQMNQPEMDQSILSQLRVHLLMQPQNSSNWALLARELTLKGDDKGSQMAAKFAAAVHTPLPDSQRAITSPVELSKASSEELQTLEQLANNAAEAMRSTGKPWIVLSVVAGTITIAAKSPSSRNAKLFLADGQSHVQVAERLVYRDPATGVRLSCLTVEPIRFADLQPRPLQQYEIEYADLRCGLSEAMPNIKIPVRFQIEEWDGMRIHGWMGFEGSDLIPRIPSALLVLDGVPLSVFNPSVLRIDVSEALGSVHRLATGFDVNGLRKLIRRESSEIQFRDPVTYELYGSYLLNRSRTFHQQIMQVSKGFCGFDFQTRDGEVVVTSLSRQRNRQPVALMESSKLDILVPVYKDWALTRQCLLALHASVSLALSAHPGRGIFIHATNDCSPDDAVNENLANMCKELGVIFRINQENLGFIRTVNNFMSSTTADVLLVNSDVILSRHCINELITARELAGGHVASLTAFSNNATIFSYPRQIVENRISSPYAIERIADAFRSAAGGNSGAAT